MIFSHDIDNCFADKSGDDGLGRHDFGAAIVTAEPLGVSPAKRTHTA